MGWDTLAEQDSNNEATKATFSRRISRMIRYAHRPGAGVWWILSCPHRPLVCPDRRSSASSCRQDTIKNMDLSECPKVPDLIAKHFSMNIKTVDEHAVSYSQVLRLISLTFGTELSRPSIVQKLTVAFGRLS